MNDMDDKRRRAFEQIRANELARGATEDEAAQTAAATVDKVLEAAEGKK